MNDDVYSGHHWRFLYEGVFDHEGDGLGDMLLRWLDEHPGHVAEVREAGQPENHLIPLGKLPRKGYSSLVRLYAVNRILDLLVLNYQDPPGDSAASPNEANPPVGVYPAFCEALGADRISRQGFHPFFHEVVEVRPVDDPDEPPSIVEERWPGYMMGSMLLMRAGVVVTAGARHLVAGVADRSTLYWTFWRLHDLPVTSRTVGGATHSGELTSAVPTWSTAGCTTTWTRLSIRTTRSGETTRTSVRRR